MTQSSEIMLIGSDHAGYAMKEYIKKELTRLNISFEDVGVYNEDRSDYPLYAAKVASRVSGGDSKRGIIVCGSGIGASITANRFRNVRAALCVTEEMAQLSRKHNDANVLSLGARFIDNAQAISVVEEWLNTPFSKDDRHIRRIEKIDNLKTN